MVSDTEGGLDVAGPRVNAELINTVWVLNVFIHQRLLFLIRYCEARIDLCSHQSVITKHVYEECCFLTAPIVSHAVLERVQNTLTPVNVLLLY